MKPGIVINDQDVFFIRTECAQYIVDHFRHDISVKRIKKITYEVLPGNSIVDDVHTEGRYIVLVESADIFPGDSIKEPGKFDADYFFKRIRGCQNQRFSLARPKIMRREEIALWKKRESLPW